MLQSLFQNVTLVFCEIISRIWLLLLSWTKVSNFLLWLCQWFQEYPSSLCLQSTYSWICLCLFFLIYAGCIPVRWLLICIVFSFVLESQMVFRKHWSSSKINLFHVNTSMRFYFKYISFFSHALLISHMQFFRVLTKHVIN